MNHPPTALPVQGLGFSSSLEYPKKQHTVAKKPSHCILVLKETYHNCVHVYFIIVFRSVLCQYHETKFTTLHL